MKKERKPINAAIVVPIERRITQNGTVLVTEIIGTTKESVKKGVELMSSMAETKIIREIKEIKHSSRPSFGISNWDNCLWNPKGPKPNWAAPEDPSKN